MHKLQARNITSHVTLMTWPSSLSYQKDRCVVYWLSSSNEVSGSAQIQIIELTAVRRTQPSTKRPKFLQWLHGRQQQQQRILYLVPRHLVPTDNIRQILAQLLRGCESVSFSQIRIYNIYICSFIMLYVQLSMFVPVRLFVFVFCRTKVIFVQ